MALNARQKNILSWAVPIIAIGWLWVDGGYERIMAYVIIAVTVVVGGLVQLATWLSNKTS